MKIEIPLENYLNYNWDKILRIVSNAKHPENIKIDLSAVQFLRPEVAIMLIALSHKISSLSSQPVSWINPCLEVHSYLERLDIYNISFVNLPPIKKKFVWNRTKCQSNNLMELQIINTDKQCADTIKKIKGILASHFPERISSGFCRDIPTLISEIAGNSLEHSERNQNGKCYFIAQKYEGKKGKRVVVTFGDCGIGIRNSLKIHNTWLADNDVLAIKKAFIDGVTSREDKSGGLGFKRVKSILEEYNGEITIRSGRGAIRYDTKKSDPLSQSKYYEFLPGTQTALIL